jgi:multiple sugar transport system permease protein
VTSDAAAAPPPRTLRQRIFGETPSAWAFVAPAAVIIVGLAIVPIAWSLVLSFRASDLLSPGRSVGFANYDALLDDPDLRSAVGHTLLFTGLFVPLSLVLGLLLAIALNRRIRLIGFYRTAILLPFIASTAVQGVLFSYIFDQRFGVANAFLDKLGIARQGFLGDPDQAMLVIVLIALWGGIGFSVIIYLAALQDVPRDLVDAARVDGSKRFGVLRHVVLPQLMPVTVFLVIWQTLLSLQLFDLVYATTRGGPLDSTVVVVYYIYKQAFVLFNAGYAAAIAYIVAALLIALACLQIVYQRLSARRA